MDTIHSLSAYLVNEHCHFVSSAQICSKKSQPKALKYFRKVHVLNCFICQSLSLQGREGRCLD